MAHWPLPPDLHARITSGPLCPFAEHSYSSLDGQVPRYDDSHACVRCVAALSEGRLELRLPRIHPQFRQRFLEFWSLVEVGSPDECWEWRGARYASGNSSYFPFRRHWGKGRQYAAPRVATWFSWGDVGRLPIRHVCGNRFCCNPLHIRVEGVPHFHHRRQLPAMELFPAAQQLVDQTQAYIEAACDHSPAALARLERANLDWIRFRLGDEGALSEEEPEEPA